jgi:hypothetical protein
VRVDSTAARSRSTTASAVASETPAAAYVLDPDIRASLPRASGADRPPHYRAAASKRSFATPAPFGTSVGYDRVKQARQTPSSGSRVAHCIPSSER